MSPIAATNPALLSRIRFDALVKQKPHCFRNHPPCLAVGVRTAGAGLASELRPHSAYLNMYKRGKGFPSPFGSELRTRGSGRVVAPLVELSNRRRALASLTPLPAPLPSALNCRLDGT